LAFVAIQAAVLGSGLGHKRHPVAISSWPNADIQALEMKGTPISYFRQAAARRAKQPGHFDHPACQALSLKIFHFTEIRI